MIQMKDILIENRSISVLNRCFYHSGGGIREVENDEGASFVMTGSLIFWWHPGGLAGWEAAVSSAS